MSVEKAKREATDIIAKYMPEMILGDEPEYRMVVDEILAIKEIAAWREAWENREEDVKMAIFLEAELAKSREETDEVWNRVSEARTDILNKEREIDRLLSDNAELREVIRRGTADMELQSKEIIELRARVKELEGK